MYNLRHVSPYDRKH